MKNSYLKLGIVFVLMSMTAGCATNGSYGYAPYVNEYKGYNANQGLHQHDMSSAIPAMGLVMRKEESEHMQIMLFIAPEVGRQVGVEMFDTLKQHGFVQVTSADVSNDTEVDVICRLGADSSQIAVECRTISLRIKTPLSTGSIALDQNIMNKYGPERIRNAVATMVDEKYVEVVNTAVEILSKQER